MSTSEHPYPDLVAALKELRRVGLNASSLPNTVFEESFTGHDRAVWLIERLILGSPKSDGLAYLIGAYAMEERFSALDLTRRRKLFAEIIGVSERTLIRREDAAIERLAEVLGDLRKSEDFDERNAIVKRMVLGMKDSSKTADSWVRELTADNSSRSITPGFLPTSDLVAAITHSLERMRFLQLDVANIQSAMDSELKALQGLIERIDKSE